MGGVELGERWVPVARSDAVTTTPQAVDVEGRSFVAVRLRPDGPAELLAQHCPHRLVPLSAATVVDGRLRCAYHGWEFGPDGSCAVLPSLGENANIPPKAHLAAAPRAREADGRLWACASDLPAAALPDWTGVLTNEDPRLRRAWHPAALADELDERPTPVRLVGAEWTVRRVDGTVLVEPEPYGVTEKWGLVWLAPERPVTELFTDPDAEDADYVGAWLRPARTRTHAGFAADNFLDVAHFPFIHTGTFGASADKVVRPAEVEPAPDGFRSSQEQWFDNPEDRGVAEGLRPVRQRRRATFVYRAPFQMLLRLEEVEAGSVKTILFFAQPETATSTRLYTKMLFHGIDGQERPGPGIVAREVDFEERVLAEDLALQDVVTTPGLPLQTQTELHVKADRLGVALRRELARFLDRAARG